jgi:arylsulfatase A-like enzyme
MMYMYETDGDMGYKWEHHFGPLSMVPDWPADEANGIPGYKGWRLYGKPFRYVNDEDRDLLADELCADWSAEIIERTHEKPYALFAGFVRTHTPLYAPDEYFDRFPLDSIDVPETIENDLDDCADALADRSLYGFRRYRMLVRHEDRQLYKQWLQAYLACVSFVDDQVGKILDAVDKSPQRDNTVVIVTSDHGFHMGEKQFLYKQSLWDGATRVPLIVAGLEGMPEGATCDQPVSLIDIYPTINDLCGLPTEPNASGNGYQLEGHSLRPLLTNPKGGWTGPDVAITALPGKDHSQHNRHGGTWFPHFSVRSKQYRYTLCANGEEELYDFNADPLEWRNLANDPAYAESKAALKAQLIGLRDGQNWQTLDSLNSWTYDAYKGGAKKAGGELQFAGGASFYLATIRKFQNFELQFDLKSANADRLRISYRAEIDNNRIMGTIVSIPPAPSNLEGGPVEFRVGDWNRYRIRVLGDRCRVWINESLHSDVREREGLQQGVIGIELPGVETRSVQLRQCRIRPL